MSREKTFIDEMNCKMIDEMSDAVVDDTKSSSRREFNELGFSGRPKVADSNKHSEGSHLCEEGEVHEMMERRRSVDYSTVSSESKSPPFTAQSTQRSSSQQNASGGKGLAAVIMIVLFIIGIAAKSAGMIVMSVILLIALFGKKNNGSSRK